MGRILMGKGERRVHLLGRYGNRHGLVAGATGTGKTCSLMVAAEGFSRLGVPVFLADVKGDVAGLSQPGAMTDDVRRRVEEIGIEDHASEGSPVLFWDLYGEQGHPVRTTVCEIGPGLLGRILGLDQVQEGVLEVAFKIADEQGLLLLDLADLRAMLAFLLDHHEELSRHYGLATPAALGGVQRALLALEREGGGSLFGEPALDLEDLMRTDDSGRGYISVLAADRLVLRRRLYSSFLLWLLSELYERLPEVGDRDLPRLVIMFDEAHLLFDDAPRELCLRVQEVMRIIRSKGVGVLYCSQYADDVPAEIAGQLGNRIQHALRANTPRDQQAVRTAAETMVNPAVDVASALPALGVGEALVSTLQENAVPLPVERALISPPRSRMGPITSDERAAVRRQSPLGPKYDQVLSRVSAQQVLSKRVELCAGSPIATALGAADDDRAFAAGSVLATALTELLADPRGREGAIAVAKQAAREIGGKESLRIIRGVLGGVLGGKRDEAKQR